MHDDWAHTTPVFTPLFKFAEYPHDNVGVSAKIKKEYWIFSLAAVDSMIFADLFSLLSEIL